MAAAARRGLDMRLSQSPSCFHHVANSSRRAMGAQLPLSAVLFWTMPSLVANSIQGILRSALGLALGRQPILSYRPTRSSSAPPRRLLSSCRMVLPMTALDRLACRGMDCKIDSRVHLGHIERVRYKARYKARCKVRCNGRSSLDGSEGRQERPHRQRD